MKLGELIEFVQPFALDPSQAREERVIESKSQTTMNEQSDSSGYLVLTSVSDIEQKLLPEWNAALLYVAQKNELTHLELIEEISREYGQFLNVALLVVDSETNSAELKREFKSSKLPQFRFYPNLKTGEEKHRAAYEIVLPRDADDVKEAVLEEI